MFFEKFLNSKFYAVIEMIVKIVWLNIITLITSVLGLFLFTFGPALLSGVYVAKLIINKYEGPILKVYFKAFKRFYKKGTLIFLIYSGLLILFSFNVYFFLEKMNQNFLWFDLIAFLITILLLMLTIPGLIHSLLIFSCFEKNSIKSLIIDGFKLSMAFILNGILFSIVLTAIIVLALVVPLTIFLVSFVTLVFAVEVIMFRPYDKIEFFDKKSTKIADELIREI
ncbi:MAG: DUF624 domain-containing protein [Acholeplasmataceae bacterium]